MEGALSTQRLEKLRPREEAINALSGATDMRPGRRGFIRDLLPGRCLDFPVLLTSRNFALLGLVTQGVELFLS
jgi:hypothetical protein